MLNKVAIARLLLEHDGFPPEQLDDPNDPEGREHYLEKAALMIRAIIEGLIHPSNVGMKAACTSTSQMAGILPDFVLECLQKYLRAELRRVLEDDAALSEGSS